MPIALPQELAHKLAMQVVGAGPKYLDRSAVPSEALQAESAVLREQALKSGALCWLAAVAKVLQGGCRESLRVLAGFLLVLRRPSVSTWQPLFQMCHLTPCPPCPPNAGKPEKIVDRIVAGRLDKYYGEVCLLEQAFIMDGDLKVGGAGCFATCVCYYLVCSAGVCCAACQCMLAPAL